MSQCWGLGGGVGGGRGSLGVMGVTGVTGVPVEQSDVVLVIWPIYQPLV